MQGFLHIPIPYVYNLSLLMKCSPMMSRLWTMLTRYAVSC